MNGTHKTAVTWINMAFMRNKVMILDKGLNREVIFSEQEYMKAGTYT